MNYLNTYNQIIQKAKQRGSTTGYTERHHIIPKCMGGTNDPTNIVELTAREHFLCHWLLAREYGGKLVHAFNNIATLKNPHQYRYTPSSRAVAEAKELLSKEKKLTYGKKVLQYTLTGEFVKEYVSATATEMGTTVYKCLNGTYSTAKGFIWIWKSDKKSLPLRIRWAQKNRTSTNKRVVAQEVVRRKSLQQLKPILQYTISGDFVREWKSQKEVKKQTNINIAPHLRNKAKTAGGYIWKYKSYVKEVTKVSKGSMGKQFKTKTQSE